MEDNMIVSPEYKAGLKLGQKLADGFSQEVSEELSNYTQQLAREQQDPNVLQRQKADLMAGMRVADPDDVRLVLDPEHRAHYEIDWESEKIVNNTFRCLNRFNQFNTSDRSEKTALGDVVQKVNRYLEESIPEQIQSDFVADFNRRRQNNQYLLTFEAYQTKGKADLL